MISIERLLEAAFAQEATFELEGSQVFVAAPAPLPAELMAQLRERKPEVIAYLSREPDSPPVQGVQSLLAWASELAEQDVVLPDPVSYLEVPQRTITTGRVSWYAGHYLKTITSARIGQQTGDWGMFNAQWHKERESEALYALAALREAMEGLPQEKDPDR